MVRGSVHRLLAPDIALDKLGARGISAHEAEQLLRNRHVTVRNPREAAATWLIGTGWGSTEGDRRMLEER